MSNQPEPIANPRESRDLNKVIFAAQWGGFHYVVDEGSYYQITDRPFDRKIVWTDPTWDD